MKNFITLSFFLFVAGLSFGQSPKVYFNFGKNYQGSFPWNNANADPTYGLLFSNLLDDDSLNTGIGIQLLTNWGGLYNEGAVTGDNSGIVPDNVLKEYYYFGIFGAPDEVRLRVSGLVPGASYNFRFIGSSTFRGAGVTDNGMTSYQVGSQFDELYVDGNTDSAALVANVIVPEIGEVDVVMKKIGDTPVGYINAMIIEMPSGVLYSPSNFTVSPVNGVTLQWKDNSDSETGYEIYRTNIIDNNPFELIATTAASDTLYNDTTVLAGYTYWYKIRAKGISQTSGFTQVMDQRVEVETGEALTVGRKVYVNFGRDHEGPFPWNNTCKDPLINSRFSFIDDAGNATGIYAELLTEFGGVYFDGATTGDDSGVFPDNVLREYYWFGALGSPEFVRLRVGGLPPGIVLNAKFHGGSVFRGLGITDNGHTQYVIGLDTVSLDVEGNTSNLATFSGLVANKRGEFILQVAKGTDALTGYLNAMLLELSNEIVYTPSGFKAAYVTGSGVELNWIDNNTGETGYEIYRRSVTDSGSYSLLATTSINAVTYLDNSVDAEKLYSYKIRTVGSSFNSAYSRELEVKTKPVKKVYINFSRSYNPGGYWNNTATNPISPFEIKNVKDEFGKYTGLDMSFGSWGGVNNAGAITGDNSGIVPDSVLQEFYWFGFLGAPEQEKIVLRGLPTDKTYNFRFIASSVFRGAGVTDNGSTMYSIGVASDTLYVEGNTDEWAEINEVSPDENGRIEISLRKVGYAAIGYLNAMVIELPEALLYAPGNFRGYYLEDSGNQLAWLDNSTSETGFEIQRRNVTTNGPYTTVTTASADAQSWLDTAISEGNVYSYRIKALNAIDTSAWVVSSDVRSIPIKKVLVNFGGVEVASSPWNNALANPVAGTMFTELLDDNNNNSGISIVLENAWGGFYNQGAVTGSNSGVVPDAVLKEYLYFGIFGAPNRESIKIKGLDPSKEYNFKFLGSTVFSGAGDNGSTIYRIGSDSVALYVQNNSTGLAEFYGVFPNTNGEIQVQLAKGPTAPAGYLNAMIIELREDQLYAPAQITADYDEEDGVILNWVDNNIDETAYKVYRSVGNENNFLPLATVGANIETYADTAIDIGNSYKYMMVALRDQEQSVNSSVISIATIPTHKIYFSFGKNYAAASPWNNAGKDPSSGLLFDGLADDEGKATTIQIELLTAFGGVYDQGATTGSNSGIIPDNALKEYYYFGVFGSPSQTQIRISGLSIGFGYNLSLVASSVFHDLGISDNGHTIFTINGISKSVDAEGNTSMAAIFRGVMPDDQGRITITIDKGTDATVGYLNAIIIEGADIPSEYYALRDGNWTDPIWSHFKTSTDGVVLPSNSEARIEGKHVVSSSMISVQNLLVSAADGNPGILTLNGGLLINEGGLTISNNHSSNRIDLLGSSQIKVRPRAKRIMPIGNSITQGSATTYSYRYSLWRKLIDASVNFDFVGSQSTNNGGNPTFPPYKGQEFDTDNEGHWGKRADEILAGLPAWLASARPDIVLLHAGTNDMLQFQSVASTKEELRAMIRSIRGANSNVVILLATLIPNTMVDMSGMKTAITALASEENTEASPIILVDQYTGFNAANDTYDGIHPKPIGEEKMAKKWFDAIMEIID